MSSDNPDREFSNLLLANWKSEPDLRGGRLVSILSSQNLDFEVRESGEVPEVTNEELRASLLSAAEKDECAWECDPEGLGYPLRHGQKLLGLCILYPTSDVHPLSLWQQRIESYTAQIGPILTEADEDPPSLSDLAGVIPDRIRSEEDESAKLHWEQSKTRVEVPVHEELSRHLLLDHMPLF